MHFPDIDRTEMDSEGFTDPPAVGDVFLFAGRQHDAVDVFTAKGPGTDGRGDGGIFSAGDADDNL